MKNLHLLPLMVAILLGCSFLRQKQVLESEKNDLSGGGGEPIKFLTLNNENVGSRGYSNLGDPDVEDLQRRLTEIKKEREKHGVFEIDSNEIYSFVFLAVPGNVQIGDAARLAKMIRDSGCKLLIPATHPRPSDPYAVKPNPLTLVVRVNHAEFDETVDSDPENYKARPTFEWVADRSELKMYRLNQNSIEIDAKGNYYVNHQQDIFKASDPLSIDVKQELISEQSLEAEMNQYVDRSNPEYATLRVIAIGSAKHEKLLRIFAIADRMGVSTEVYMRGSLLSEENKNSRY